MPTPLSPRTLALALSLPLALAAAPALAQEEHDPLSMSGPMAGDIEDLDINSLLDTPTTTATKTATSARVAPATIYVITDEDIKARGYLDLMDALRDIPSVHFTHMVLAESGANKIFVRGLPDNNKVVLLLNGRRFNIAPKAQDHQFAHDLPLVNIKRIEVSIGPASALYGADAMSAVVNLITKTGAEDAGLRIGASYGLANQTSDYLSYGAPLDPDSSLLVMGRFYRDTYDNVLDDPQYQLNNGGNYLGNWPEPQVMDNSTNTNTQLVSYRHKAFSLDFLRVQKNMSAAPLGRDFRYANNADGRWQDAVHTLILGYDVEVSGVSSRTALTYENFLLHPLSNFHWNSSLETDASGTPTNDPSKIPGLSDPATAQAFWHGYKFGNGRGARLEQTFQKAFSDDLNVVAGVTVEDFDSVPQTTDLINRPMDPNKSITDQGFPPVGLHYLQFQNYGAYVQTELGYVPNLKTTLGLRYDYNTRYSPTLNPRLGLVYTPTDETTLKLLYGSSYIAPTTQQAYLTWGVPGQYMHLPNPDLAPQRAQTFELSASQILNRNLSLTGTLFQNNLSDMIFIEYGISQPVLEKPTSGERFANIGSGMSRGAELRLDALLFNQRAYLGATLLDSSLQIQGGQQTAIPDTVPVMAKGGLTMKPLDWLSVTPRFVYFSGRTTKPSSPQAGVTQPGVFSLDLGAVAKVTDRLELTLTASNLLDQNYYAFNAYDAHTGLDLIPQPGRRVLLGANYRF